jgi:signal transduction histidine kinase
VPKPPPIDVIGSLLGLLAHDLRNPLSALQSNCAFVRAADTRLQADECEALDDALASCDSLLHIIDSVDLLSQVLHQTGQRAAETVRIAAVVDDVVARHRVLASSYAVGIEVDASARDVESRAVVNRDLFTRALGYLLRNGLQCSRTGSSVQVLARQKDRRIAVIVADRGPALSEDMIARAFTAEGQLAAKGTADGRYSRGLGLYCARVAAELAGAEVGLVEPPAGLQTGLALSAPSR